DQRGTDAEVVAVADHQHLVEFDRAVDIRDDFLHAQDFTWRDAVLLTACNDDCIHCWQCLCSYSEICLAPTQRSTRPKRARDDNGLLQAGQSNRWLARRGQYCWRRAAHDRSLRRGCRLWRMHGRPSVAAILAGLIC